MRKRWKVFADTYLGLMKHDPPVPAWNATRAYLVVSPRVSEATAAANGSRLLTNAKINEYIQFRLHEMQLGPEETKCRLAEQATINICEFVKQTWRSIFDDDGVEVDVVQVFSLDWDMVKAKGRLIKSIVNTQYGPKLELYDGQNALIHIGKIHKLFTDKREIDISDRLAAKLENYTKAAEKIYAESISAGEVNSDSA